MEYLGTKTSDNRIQTPSDEFSDYQIQQIETIAKNVIVRTSSSHTSSPPTKDDELYICTSSSVSQSSPIVLPTGCPIGKKIIIKCTGANGYVKSTEGITGLTSSSKSTSATSVSKYPRSFIYSGTTYGWIMTY